MQTEERRERSEEEKAKQTDILECEWNTHFQGRIFLISLIQ